MTKVTTGRAGAVRIQPLKMNDLTLAENHGKRLDESSKARAIYADAPPLTTTGLDVTDLYRKHVDGVFVPKNNTKALHMIVQFPTELVDGEDPKYMLEHARGMAENVFGKRAIFADRIDRDERGRHVVDLFLAPIYTKKTKHTEKEAVGLSVHTKKLANKQYPEETRIKPDGKVREINVYDIGRALQDAMFDYLRIDMGLEQALRGSPKLAPGVDWKASEELRLQELADLKQRGEAETRLAERLRVEASATQAAAVQHEMEARAERQRQEQATKDMKVALHAAELERQNASEVNALAHEARAGAEKERADAERLRMAAETDARRLREEIRCLQENADRLVVQAQHELATARTEAEEVRKSQLLLRQERDALAAERQRDGLRLDLLERAMDHSSGLNLRPEGDKFLMEERHMSRPEQEAYRSGWPKALFEIARRLAAVLEKVRNLLKFADVERDALAKRKDEANKTDAELRQRKAALAGAERDLEAKASSVAEQVETARAELSRAQQEQQAQDEWGRLLLLVTIGQLELTQGPGWGRTATAANGQPAEAWVQDRLKTTPPPWADNAITAFAQLERDASIAEEKQQEVFRHAAYLEKVVEQAEMAFTPAQVEAVAAAKEALAPKAAHQAAHHAAQMGSGRG